MSSAKLARWLHLGHRWLGMGLGVMVLLWFISGVVMLFVARPQLDAQAHLAALPEKVPEKVPEKRVMPEKGKGKGKGKGVRPEWH